jgi:phosphoribosylanthranilate isomerase
VDVASGVEVDGDPRRKDRHKMAAFFGAILAAG